MNEPIIFTISDILWLAGAIVAISAAVKVISDVVNGFRKPNVTQDIRIAKLEERTEIIFNRLNEAEKGNAITQRALLALLSHGIDGNDVDAMRQAKKELTDYLINR